MQSPDTIDGLRNVLKSIGYDSVLNGVHSVQEESEVVKNNIEYVFSNSDQTAQDTRRRDQALSYVSRFQFPEDISAVCDLLSSLVADGMDIEPVDVTPIEEEDGSIDYIEVEIPEEHISAGVVKHPPKMVNEVVGYVESDLASYTLWFLDKDLKGNNKDLAFYDTTGNAQVQPPKVSGAILKKAKGALEYVKSLIEEYREYGENRFSDWSDEGTSEITMFISGMQRKFSMSRSAKLSDIGSGDLEYNRMSRGIANVLNAKKVIDLDEYGLRVLASSFFVMGRTRRYKYSKAASKALINLLRYIEDKKNAASRSSGEVTLSESQTRERDKLLEEQKSLIDLKTYLERKGYKKSKRKPGPNSEVKRDIVVDLSGLPDSYPTDAYDEGMYDKIVVSIVPGRASYRGSWSKDSRTLRVVIRSMPMSVSKFKAAMRQYRSTIEHELEHMVQSLMSDSLDLRKHKDIGSGPIQEKSLWNRPGTPGYGRGNDAADNDVLPALRRKYPSASDEDLYWLTPNEFFPQVRSSVVRFFSVLENGRYSEAVSQSDFENSMLDMWRSFANASNGRSAHDKIYADVFYTTLKKYDRAAWKRAVSEGYSELMKRVSSGEGPKLSARALADLGHLVNQLVGPNGSKKKYLKFGGKKIETYDWADLSDRSSWENGDNFVIVVPQDLSWYGPLPGKALATKVAVSISKRGDATSKRKLPMSSMKLIHSKDWPMVRGIGSLSRLHRSAANCDYKSW